MSTTKIYPLSLTCVEEYLLSNRNLSKYPLNSKLSHAIRQIVDLTMDTFEEWHLVIPSLPESFSIDALPQPFEDDLRFFLNSCLKDSVVIEISYSNEKMTIFLE